MILKVLLIIPITVAFTLYSLMTEYTVSANNGDYKTWKQYEGKRQATLKSIFIVYFEVT